MRNEIIYKIYKEVFNSDKNLIKDIKPHLEKLRESYKVFPCNTNYSDDNIKKAYLFYYYPAYISLINETLSEIPNIKLKKILNKDNLNICFFGCGAAPELYGFTEFLRKNKNDIKEIDAYFFDYYIDDWGKYLDRITLNTIKNEEHNCFYIKTKTKRCNLLKNCSDCQDRHDCMRFMVTPDIFIFQNCFNDILENQNTIKEKVMTFYKYAKKGSVFIIIDLAFPEIRDLLKNISNWIYEIESEVLKQLTPNFQLIKNEYKNEQKIIFGDKDMIYKSTTKYYSLVFKKPDYTYLDIYKKINDLFSE